MPDQATDNPTPPDAEPATPTKRVPRKPSSETKPAPDSTTKKGKKQKPEPTTPMGKLWHGWIRPIGSVVIVVVLIRSTLIDWNDVPTGSMEPEIHVGDRIAVNRLAYAFQFPLTGPTIGVPFTPLQWDNPLDGIPQIQYAEPQRGDIVTFWNPISKIRMVKRIVAKPGDTISMSGGVMTINGQTATYVELDAAAEGLPLQTKYLVPSPLGGQQYERKDLVYKTESLLGQTRTAQHIMDRWIDEVQFIELNNGDRAELADGKITRIDYLSNQRAESTLGEYIARNPTPVRFATIREGIIYIDDKEVSYNDLAEIMFADFSDGPRADVIAQSGLTIEGHKLLYKGEAVSLEVFESRARAYATPLKAGNEKIVFGQLIQTLKQLGGITTTTFGPITLGDDEYFMVGDNRNNSHDSRFFGPVDRGEITGKAFAVAFSFNDNKMLALPPDPAWERFFKDLD